MSVEGAEQTKEKIGTMILTYKTAEQDSTDEIVALEETLAMVEDYHRKKEALETSIERINEKLQDVILPTRPPELNINNLTTQQKQVDRILEQQQPIDTQLVEFESFAKNIPDLSEKENASVEGTLKQLRDSNYKLCCAVEQQRNVVQNSIIYLNNYASGNEDISSWLHNQEDILNNFNFESTLERKLEQKEDLTTVLQTAENQSLIHI
mgnify:CR=1 FL=1